MLGVARWTVLPGLLASWLLLPAMAHAIVPEVRDNGKFFDTQTVAKANALIKRIEDKDKKDVAVETFGEISDEIAKKFQYDPKNRDAFYKRWLDDLAEGGKINGIVILIVRDQHNDKKTHIEVGVGGATQKRAFTSANRNELFSILKNGFLNKQPNQALLEGLRFIDDTIAAHIARESAPLAAQNPARPAPARSADREIGGSNILGWICIGLCVVAAIWLVKGLFRAMSGGAGGGGGGGYAGGPGYAGGGGGGGGGGFMSGMLGGLFGAVAGNWIYNNMFGGSSYHQSTWGGSNAYGNEPGSPTRDDAGPSDQGQGFSSTGGDVDEGGGGGGDVDSGDAGGGDAGGGGGDWGGGGGDAGGGGDWGGGGGDFGGGGGGDFGGGGGDW